jgi:hypothetical protein
MKRDSIKNIKIYLLCAIFCFTGCKAVKNLVGWDKGEKVERTEQPKKIIVPPTHKVPVTTKTVTNLLLYCAITLTVLFAIRYGVKRFRQKNE